MPWFLTPVTVYIETEAPDLEDARLGAQTLVDKRINECEFGYRENDQSRVRASMTEVGETEPDGDDEEDDDGGDHEPDDSMDGDHESALASAGFGTDEDYGDFGGGDEG